MGKHNAYSPEIHEFVRTRMHEARDRELAEMTNREFGTHFTDKSIESFRKNHGYTVPGRKKGLTHEEIMERRPENEKQAFDYILTHSEGISAEDMAETVNKLFGTQLNKPMVLRFRRRHGISSGLDGKYAKGRRSHNKGKKQEEFMSPEAIARSKKTRFQSGSTPGNTLPAGSVVKSADGYMLIKVSMTGTQWERWKFLHRYVWEEANGEIPEGMVLEFKDGNRENCSLENLALVSRSEHTLLTAQGLRFSDPDLTEAGINVVRLQQAVKNRKRGKEQ